jgi:hypothetical protein
VHFIKQGTVPWDRNVVHFAPGPEAMQSNILAHTRQQFAVGSEFFFQLLRVVQGVLELNQDVRGLEGIVPCCVACAPIEPLNEIADPEKSCAGIALHHARFVGSRSPSTRLGSERSIEHSVSGIFADVLPIGFDARALNQIAEIVDVIGAMEKVGDHEDVRMIPPVFTHQLVAAVHVVTFTQVPLPDVLFCPQLREANSQIVQGYHLRC